EALSVRTDTNGTRRCRPERNDALSVRTGQQKLLDMPGKAVTLDGRELWPSRSYSFPPIARFIMKRTRQFGGRAKVRPGTPSYRPQLEFLEDRLPLGDALLGALLGSSLIAPGLREDLAVLDNTAGPLPFHGSIAPWFAEPANPQPAVVHLSFLDDALGTGGQDWVASYRKS